MDHFFFYIYILLNSHYLSTIKKGVQHSEISISTILNKFAGCPRGVMVKAMDCGIVISEFVLQSRYYVHFRANTLGKGMKPLILPAMG